MAKNKPVGPQGGATMKADPDWKPDDLAERVGKVRGAYATVLRIEAQIESLKASSKLAKDELHKAKKRLGGFLAESFEALPLFAQQAGQGGHVQDVDKEAAKEAAA